MPKEKSLQAVEPTKQRRMYRIQIGLLGLGFVLLVGAAWYFTIVRDGSDGSDVDNVPTVDINSPEAQPTLTNEEQQTLIAEAEELAAEGQPAAAASKYLQAAEITEVKREKASLYQRAGLSSFSAADYETALDYYGSAKSLYEEIGLTQALEVINLDIENAERAKNSADQFGGEPV